MENTKSLYQFEYRNLHRKNTGECRVPSTASRIQAKATFRGGLLALTPLSLAASSAQHITLCNDAGKLVMPPSYTGCQPENLAMHVLRSNVYNNLTKPARHAVISTTAPQATNVIGMLDWFALAKYNC